MGESGARGMGREHVVDKCQRPKANRAYMSVAVLYGAAAIKRKIASKLVLPGGSTSTSTCWLRCDSTPTMKHMGEITQLKCGEVRKWNVERKDAR